jgi:hypothetical protein
MATLWRLVAVSMLSLALAGVALADTVQVYAGGKLRGAFEPRGEPYAADGPSVSVYLEKRDVKTPDGQALTGFELIGWREGQGVRVQVFLLVPAKGEANAYLPEGKAERLARRHFSSMLLAKGDEVLLTKMRELGLEPMKLRLR